MLEFWFYIRLGFNHVMDPQAYDHILFLLALAIPFTIKSWKKVVILATIFTLMHCLSLGLAVYDLLEVDVALTEFLIPVTIFATALLNTMGITTSAILKHWYFHGTLTAFFGFIHGLGFSNYFNILMDESIDKSVPLLGFALGIEVAQVAVILVALLFSYVFLSVFRMKHSLFVLVASLIIALITIPMLIATFPW